MASIALKGAASGQIALTVPPAAGDNTALFPPITGSVLISPVDMIMPSDLGTSGQALTTDGAGNLSWASVGGGCVPTAPQVTIPDSSPSYSDFVLDGSLGSSQSILVEGNFNLSFANFGAVGSFCQITLEVINTGPFIVNWPPTSYWPSGVDPQLTPADANFGRDIFSFTTNDGGATVYCNIVGKGYFLMFD